jgi:branched-chain amino acid transport system ATP-binding protein
VLSVSDLEVKYGHVSAVHGVSLVVNKGELVVLVGANGAGKTSLLSAIAGIVRPSSGRITMLEKDVTREPSHRRFRSGIVLVPEGRAIIASMTVKENLQLVSGHPDSVADRFPILRKRWTHPAGALSGGEQQMLAIARGLLSKPRLLLLDEPSLGLAPRAVTDVFDTVASLREQGTTVLLVEQNARRALHLADRGYVMETGRIVTEGPGPDLAGDKSVIEAYLGGPVAEVASRGRETA